MDPQQQFCLKWNSYSSNLAMTFSSFFKSDILADVTLSCNGTAFKAHKLILAACSKKFADLFETAPTNGQCVVILEATTPDNMAALLEFMYKGEVHVSQEALNSFLKSAENLQVKGLSTEHGRLATGQSAHSHDTPNQDVVATNRGGRNNRNTVQGSSGAPNSGGHLGLGSSRQECDSLMHPNAANMGGMSPYLPPIYRPLGYEPPRKQALRSPYTELQEVTRGSVLRDGKTSTDASPHSKQYRPSSSASSTAPTEPDTMQSERASPQSSNRYDSHSPPSTTAGNGKLGNTGCQDQSEPTECNNGSSTNTDPNGDNKNNSGQNDNGAEDLRVKMENNYSPPPPALTSVAITPTTTLDLKALDGLPGGLAASIDPADMLNVWNATKLNNKKQGMVNTADGKKFKCLYCDRLYGYETNLRAHIRQRHQGIRVPCAFCSRTFTRNNTVRRHIAREHKHEISINQMAAQNHSK